jgi:hypothetical protein
VIRYKCEGIEEEYLAIADAEITILQVMLPKLDSIEDLIE